MNNIHNFILLMLCINISIAVVSTATSDGGSLLFPTVAASPDYLNNNLYDNMNSTINRIQLGDGINQETEDQSFGVSLVKSITLLADIGHKLLFGLPYLILIFFGASPLASMLAYLLYLVYTFVYLWVGLEALRGSNIGSSG